MADVARLSCNLTTPKGIVGGACHQSLAVAPLGAGQAQVKVITCTFEFVELPWWPPSPTAWIRSNNTWVHVKATRKMKKRCSNTSVGRTTVLHTRVKHQNRAITRVCCSPICCLTRAGILCCLAIFGWILLAALGLTCTTWRVEMEPSRNKWSRAPPNPAPDTSSSKLLPHFFCTSYKEGQHT